MSSWGSMQLLQTMARQELLHILQIAEGIKDLVIDASLLRPLDCVAGMAFLRQQDVDKIFEMSPDLSEWNSTSTSQHRVYIVSPTAATARAIVAQWQAHKRSIENDRKHGVLSVVKKMTVVFVPRKTFVCEHIFEQLGVHSEFTITEFNPYAIACESDLLSMCIPSAFHSSFVDNVNTWHMPIAKTLWHIQCLFGPVQWVHALGTASSSIARLVDTISHEFGTPKTQDTNMFTRCYIFDRTLDLVSPCVTAFTYESLIHETFTIDCATVDFPEVVTSKLKARTATTDETVPPMKTRLPLNNDCSVYAEARDKHIAAVFPHLSAKAKDLHAVFQKSQQLDTVAKMKNFVADDLKMARAQHRSLELHICASEVLSSKWMTGIQERMLYEHSTLVGDRYKDVFNYTLNALCQPVPAHRAISLMCLLSTSHGGLPHGDYETMTRHFLHAYGYEHLIVLHNLAYLGMLVDKSVKIVQSAPAISRTTKLTKKLTSVASNLDPSSGAFRILSKRLALIPKIDAAQSVTSPTDMSYVYNYGMTPTLPQLVRHHVKNYVDKGVPQNKDAFHEDEGTYAQWFQTSTFSRRYAQPRMCLTTTPTTRHLIVMVGGVTYAEMAAFRMLGAQLNCAFTVLTTNIMGQKQFFEMCGL